MPAEQRRCGTAHGCPHYLRSLVPASVAAGSAPPRRCRAGAASPEDRREFGQAKTECKCLRGHPNAVCCFSSFPPFALCFPRGSPGGPFGIESLCLKAPRGGRAPLPRPGPVMSARAAQTEAGTASIAMRHRLPCGTGLAVNKKTVQILTDKCKVRGMCDGAGASSWREGERVRNREKGSESEERDAHG